MEGALPQIHPDGAPFCRHCRIEAAADPFATGEAVGDHCAAVWGCEFAVGRHPEGARVGVEPEAEDGARLAPSAHSEFQLGRPKKNEILQLKDAEIPREDICEILDGKVTTRKVY